MRKVRYWDGQSKPRVALFRGEWCWKSGDKRLGPMYVTMARCDWRGRAPGIGRFYEGALA